MIYNIHDPLPNSPLDQEIRTIVLKRLDDQYDKHLAQVENIRVLFMVLNDESHEVRIQAVNIIGRLANRNPATVMPSLRKALIQLLTELEYSTDVYVLFVYASLVILNRRF